VDVCAVAKTGNQIFTFLSLLALWKAEGFDQLMLGVISTAGVLGVIKSLFLVGEGGYNEEIP